MLQNHGRAVALGFFVHNFMRVHITPWKAAGVKTTPAMAAGLTDRVWSMDDLLIMMDPTRCQIGATSTVTIKWVRYRRPIRGLTATPLCG
jgi:hypothetical protein